MHRGLEVHIPQHVMTVFSAVCYMWTHNFWFYLLQFLKVTFNTTTGLLSDLTNLETGQSIKLKQNFYWSVTDMSVQCWLVYQWRSKVLHFLRVCLCYMPLSSKLAGTMPVMETTRTVTSLQVPTSSDPTPPHLSSSVKPPRRKPFRYKAMSSWISHWRYWCLKVSFGITLTDFLCTTQRCAVPVFKISCDT